MLQYTGMVEIYKTLIPFNVIMDEDPQNFNSAPSKKAWVQGVTCVKEADFKRFVIARAIAYQRAASTQGQPTIRPGENLYANLSLGEAQPTMANAKSSLKEIMLCHANSYIWWEVGNSPCLHSVPAVP